MAGVYFSTFLVFCFFVYVAPAPLLSGPSFWKNTSVHIRDCQTHEDLLVTKIQSRSRAKFAAAISFEGWIMFESPNDFTIRMFALQKNQEFLFLQRRRRRLTLKKGLPPSGVMPPNDNRFFKSVTLIHSRTNVMKHVASGRFIAKDSLKNVLLTSNPETAVNLCLVIF